MIFDSDILIWVSRGDAEAARLLNSTQDRAASVISVMEVMQGVRSKAEMKTIAVFLQKLSFRILPLTERIGYIASELIEEYALVNGLRVNDALIAATARENHEVLATGNGRHFAPIAKLSLKLFKRGQS